MTIEDIKKGLEYAAKVTGNGVFAGAYKIITEQEREIEKLKVDYSKLQKQFANYQLASDKEIKAQIKQAKIDVLNELKGKVKKRFELTKHYTCYGDIEYEIDELIEEVKE